MSQSIVLEIIRAFVLVIAGIKAQNAPEITNTDQKIFKISKETTFFTSPLLKNGRVDYFKALSKYQKPKGLTPEKNGAIYLVKAIGWQDNDDYDRKQNKSYRTLLFSKLGLKKNGKEFYAFPPEDGSELVGLTNYIQLKTKHFSFFDKKKEKLEKKLKKDLFGQDFLPWKKEERPETWKWIQMNEKPLKFVYLAVEQPFFYLPYVRTRESDNSELLLSLPLSFLGECRSIARVLTQRALNHLGENRPEEAAKDLMVIHQLARRIGSRGSIMHCVIASSMEAQANDGDYYLARHPSFSTKNLKNYTKKLQSLSKTIDIQKAINIFERSVALDAIQENAISSQNEAMSSFAKPSFLRSVLSNWIVFNWNQILIDVNKKFDEINETSTHPFLTQQKLLLQIENEMTKQREKRDNIKGKYFILKSFFMGEKYRTNILRDNLMDILMPNPRAAFDLEQHALMKHEMNIVHFNLELYKRKNGKYPLLLKDLVPRYLAKLPEDHFAKKQGLKYKSDGKAFHLYSIGRNNKIVIGFPKQKTNTTAQ